MNTKLLTKGISMFDSFSKLPLFSDMVEESIRFFSQHITQLRHYTATDFLPLFHTEFDGNPIASLSGYASIDSELIINGARKYWELSFYPRFFAEGTFHNRMVALLHELLHADARLKGHLNAEFIHPKISNRELDHYAAQLLQCCFTDIDNRLLQIWTTTDFVRVHTWKNGAHSRVQHGQLDDELIELIVPLVQLQD
jgi:hypothetical protein